MNTYFNNFFVKTDRAKTSASAMHIGKVAPLILMITLSAGLIVARSQVTSAVISAAQLCLKSLIPAIFPFMVVSEIFVRCFSSDKAPLVSAFLIGNLCGFPIGAKLLSDLYADGKIRAEQYRRYLPLCSNPGPAFTIVGVGANLWNSYLIGAALYLVTLFSSVLIFLLFSIKTGASIAPQTQVLVSNANNKDSQTGFARAFVSAVTGGTLKMLNVCGFVIFFSAFTSIFCGIFEYLELSPLFSALFYSIFEISGGTASLSELAKSGLSPALCLALTFFAHGFGGLCIYAQILSVSADADKCTENYIWAKLLQGALSALIVAISTILHIILTSGISR